MNFHLCSRDRQRGKPGAPHRDLKDLPLPAQEGAFFRKPLRSPESLTRKNGPLPSSALCGGEPKPLFGIDASALNRLRLSLSVSPPLQISFASLKIVSRALRPSSTTFRVSARVHAKRIAASLSLLASRVGCQAASALRDSRLQCHCEWNSLKDVVGLPRIAGHLVKDGEALRKNCMQAGAGAPLGLLLWR